MFKTIFFVFNGLNYLKVTLETIVRILIVLALGQFLKCNDETLI